MSKRRRPRTKPGYYPLDPCAYCGGQASTWDHIDPLSLSFDDTKENKVRSCANCNQKKGCKNLLVFLAERRAKRARIFQAATTEVRGRRDRKALQKAAARLASIGLPLESNLAVA